jgi:hypothetical protein
LAQRNLRLSDHLAHRIADAARLEKFASSAAFIRAAVEHELDGRGQAGAAVEQKVAATLDRITRDIRALSNAQQAQFAVLDALARVLLHCLPEPPADARDQCLARAKERHHRMLRMAALSMKGDGQSSLEALARDGE